MPQTAARLYGYLLLSHEPISLDRHGERGSRRILYEASSNYEGMLTAQNCTLEDGARLLKAGARDAASNTARARLEEMAEFYEVTLEAMESALRRWRARNRTGTCARLSLVAYHLPREPRIRQKKLKEFSCHEAPDRTTHPAR